MSGRADRALFDRLESFYDDTPRDRARVEPFGTLTLFVGEGVPYPFYARPTWRSPEGTSGAGGAAPTADDLAAVRARQRGLGVPEALEWVHETTPSLLTLAEASGLTVLHAPLMVLRPEALPAPARDRARVLDPDAARFADDMADRHAVANVGFGAGGTARGDQGPAERDAARPPVDRDGAAREAARVRAKRSAFAVVERAGVGAVASGAYQRAGSVAEIVGVATLPSERRQGSGAEVTRALAQHAIDTGADLVFLAAGSPEIARVYARLGFERIGTACIAAKG